MRIDRFAALLDSFGADLARWPATDAAAARALLAESPGAQALMRDAAGLDAALRASRAGPDAETLARMRAHVARQVARMPAPVPAGPLHWLRPLLPVGGGALAALLACGIWLTVSPPTFLNDATGFSAPRQIAMIESTD
jgi:hypothetical protein